MLVQLFGDEPLTFGASVAARRPIVRSRLALVDRDGVINARRPDHVKSWSEFAFQPGALDGLALLARRGWRVVVVTNQAVINRGLVGQPELAELHQRMVSAIRERGGNVTAVYACPHRPDEGCGCRKPAPGLLRAAAERYATRVDEAVFIGDQPSDLEAARRAGCRFVLVPGDDRGAPRPHARVEGCETVVADLLHAARYLAPGEQPHERDRMIVGGARC